MEKKKAWVQAAIDVDDMDLAVAIGKMALDCGAEWLEVGTPLIYRYGHDAIGMLRRALGPTATLVADYKFFVPMACLHQAEEQGADYAVFEAGYQEELIKITMQMCRDLRVKPIFCFNVHPADYTYYADLYSDMGVEYFFSHHYYTVRDKVTREMTTYDNCASFNACKNPIKYCITNDVFDTVPASVKAGADWITFGTAIHTPDYEACKKWVDMIHNAR